MVPGHAELAGNELADKFGRAAAMSDQRRVTIDLQSAKQRLHRHVNLTMGSRARDLDPSGRAVGRSAGVRPVRGGGEAFGTVVF